MDVGREDQAGGGDRPQVVVGRAGRRVAHDGQRLGQEVLDDDLLHVTVAGVAVGDRPQGVEAVLAALADADQDPGRERDGQLAGGLQRRQPTLGGLVGRVAMAVEVRVERLQHHPLAGRDGAQLGQLAGVEGTGVGVGEQAGLLEDERAHRRQVADRGVVAVLAQPVAGHVVAQLGALPEREQRLVAAGPGTGLGDLEHLRRTEVRRGDASRRLGERAVAAAVPAEHRERDEHLGGVGDPATAPLLAGSGEEVGQRGGEEGVVVHRRTVARVGSECELTASIRWATCPTTSCRSRTPRSPPSPRSSATSGRCWSCATCSGACAGSTTCAPTSASPGPCWPGD